VVGGTGIKESRLLQHTIQNGLASKEGRLQETFSSIADHHRDKTRQRLTGKPCPLGRRLCTVGRCRGEASLSTSSPHEGRRRRQVKTSLSNLPMNRPRHRLPYYHGGPREQ
jgi:hypothetical protein